MRLVPGDVACWLVKTSVPPEALVAGWRPGSSRRLRRCVRPSYRLGLMAAGQPCLLWLSGRVDPGVHAVGVLTGGPDAEPAVEVDLHLVDAPVPRGELAVVREFAAAEVVRMAAGSNPSYLTRTQLRPVLDRLDPVSRRAAGWG